MRYPLPLVHMLGALSCIALGCTPNESTAPPDAQVSVAEDGGADTGDGRADAARSDAVCRTMAKAECASCCKEAHEAALYVIHQATLTCVCKPEHCQAACKDTYCADPLVEPATPACTTCVDDLADAGTKSVCAPSVRAACLADDDCSALISCTSACHADAGK